MAAFQSMLKAVGYLGPGKTLPGFDDAGPKDRRRPRGLLGWSTARAHAAARRLMLAAGYGELASELVALATARHARTAAQTYLPEGPVRDFWAWVFSEDNPDFRDWLQAAGSLQTGKLIVGLIGDLVEPRHWPSIADRLGIMCAYQAFEVVSDNLAIGVARPAPTADPTREDRRRLLLGFNDAMVRRLRGHDHPAYDALHWIEAQNDEISLIDQSLAPDATARMMRCFAQDRGEPGLVRTLERGLREALALNIELCERTAEDVGRSPLAALSREGLIARYDAVTDCLRSPRSDPATLARRGMHAILVVPTLAIGLAVWADVCGWSEDLRRPGTLALLEHAMEDSALLVRLTNDLGYPLLQCSDVRRKRFFRRRVSTTAPLSFEEQLRRVSPRHVELSRIRKDLVHGEFNIWLDGIELDRPAPEVEPDAWAALQWFGRRYQHVRDRLDDRLTSLAQSIGDEAPGAPIKRFVEFHEMVYSHDFESEDGEYAI